MPLHWSCWFSSGILILLENGAKRFPSQRNAPICRRVKAARSLFLSWALAIWLQIFCPFVRTNPCKSKEEQRPGRDPTLKLLSLICKPVFAGRDR